VTNYLLVGLGNHGQKYQNNRHNIGYIVLDAVIQKLGLKNLKKQNNLSMFDLRIGDNKFFLLKPETYMNNSGIAVQQIKSFFKIENKNIIVIYDELDMKSSQCKIKVGGGDNGHNGIKSIDQYCGKDYLRFKVGIGRPDNLYIPISDYVLSDLSQEEIANGSLIGGIIGSDLPKLFDKDGQSVILNLISKAKLG
jgi:PTH1 family peptidyl-tRNA hydrolase